MSMFRRLLFFGILLFTLAGILHAQKQVTFSAETEKLFKEGIAFYSGGAFNEAAARFDAIILKYALNQRTTAAFIMKGKCLFRENDYVEAARVLKAFQQLYPSSSYAADAEYTLGLTYLNIRRYDDAVQAFLAAWRDVHATSASGKLYDDVSTVTNSVIDDYIPLASVRNLLRESHDDVQRQFLLLKTAEKEAERGNITEAANIADTLTRLGADSRFSEQFAALRVKLTQRNSVKVGALIPLMKNAEPSAAKEIGTDVYDGIMFALEEYKNDPRTRVSVSIDTRDTERDTTVASRAARQLVEDKDIIAILGPVFSNTTSAVADLVNRRSIPLITPTANSNGIAATGPYVFQANPDYETRGRAMARYVVEKMGFKVLAILAPQEARGKFMADGFAAEAMRMGARVVVTEWYSRGATDLKSQLANIRRVGMLEAAEPFLTFAGKLNQGDITKLIQLGVPVRTLDSLIGRSSIVSAVTLLGQNARQKIDSLEIQALYSDPRTDSLEYPVTAIQGIYIPISLPEEIPVVSSQVVYYNIQTQLLGSGEWNDIASLDASKRYCTGVLFDSDSYGTKASPKYVEFSKRFSDRFKKLPSKNTLYGYDAASLLFTLIRNGATTRETVRDALSGVRDYEGLHSRIGFSTKRVNTWLQILRYTSDEIQPVDEINVDRQ